MKAPMSPDGPVTAFGNANAERARAVVVLALDAAKRPLMDEELSAAAFLADATHFELYGRPLYGETWLRTEGTPFGVILNAEINRMRREDVIHATSLGYACAEGTSGHARAEMRRRALWITSETDRKALEEALAKVLQAPSAEHAAALARATALHGEGAAGTPIDWRAGLPADADVADFLFTAQYGAF